MKKRNSSFELLRLLCIVMIIVYHYATHGGYKKLDVDNLTNGRIFLQEMRMFGKACCSIFALITGYHMINSTVKYRKLISLYLMLYFYNFCGFLVMYSLGLLEITPGDDTLRHALIPTTWGSWYMVVYLMFSLLIPFVNPLLKSLSRQRYLTLLAVLMVMWSVLPTLTKGPDYIGALDFMFIMYSCGAFIRLHKREKISGVVLFLAFTISTMVLILSVLWYDLRGLMLEDKEIIRDAVRLHSYNSIASVVWAISLFLLFEQMYFHSKGINFLARLVPGIYLIHDNRFLRPLIWQTWWPNAEYTQTPWSHMPQKVVIVFLVCMLIELLRYYLLGKPVDWLLMRGEKRMMTRRNGRNNKK